VTLLDWGVLGASLVFIVAWGLAKSRHQTTMKSYLMASRATPWWVVGLSIMATQASAITFLSTPGQAYADGMRFVQFYFGLPLAMVVLSITAVPLYHRLNVYTAYEYLEKRFDVRVRGLTAFLFLLQRGLACGLTIYAPALVLSVLLGWPVSVTTAITGTLVVVYVAAGGTKAVNATQVQQLVIILVGMGTAFVLLLRLLPEEVGLAGAVRVAGRLGRLNAVDLTFDPSSRYNLWSGLIGGFFLALSYFGTDQSQVQRYLSGASVAQSRLGLLANGLIKVPMQFVILFVGAMVFAFYQFVLPPVFFNPVETKRIEAGPRAGELAALEVRHRQAFEERREKALAYVKAAREDDPAAREAAGRALEEADGRFGAVRADVSRLVKEARPGADGRDANYVFLRFVLEVLPPGVVGLVLAAVFAASMSSTAAELNALSTTTVVDVYLRLLKKDAVDAHYVRAGKLVTVFWGLFAVAFAQYASRLGTLIEAVNVLGSLFYGTILGVFLVAFYLKRVGATAVLAGAIAGEATVLACFGFADVGFLWLNAIGCGVVVFVALAVTGLRPAQGAPASA
jgi:SSS family transporter